MTVPLTCEAVARAALGEPAKRQGHELLWRCPRHKDMHPSLSVNPLKDVWACFPCGVSGKAWQLAALIAGLEPREKSAVGAWLRAKGLLPERARAKKATRGPCVATYTYADAAGNPISRKLRYEPGADGRKKDFSWERFEAGEWKFGLAGIALPLYRLQEVAGGPLVILTEGEKDADAGAGIGLPTATSGGVNTFRTDHAEDLRGKSVVIVADADDAGRQHAQGVAGMLFGRAASVKVAEIPGSKDLAEGIEKGWTRKRLLDHFETAPEWQPADGAEVLDAVLAFVLRFVAMTVSQARAVALWVAHTHAIEAFDFTPYLNISSAEKESGKTRLLDVCKVLVANPWSTENASAAAMVRKVHSGLERNEPVTVLFDERDSQAAGDRERAETIRGILNSGYERGGNYSRCVGEGSKQDVVDFQTFGAKAISGIGSLSDTVSSRSIPIRMKRARRGEVGKFRKRGEQGREIIQAASALKTRLAAWCAANRERLADAQPKTPVVLTDRQADCCEPLFALADLAGGNWPHAAREALVELCTGAQADDDSAGVKLLSDIKAVFYPKDDDGDPLPETGRVASEDLVNALGDMEGRPWAEWKAGKPMTKNQLAGRLARFEISPKTVRLPDGRRLKGYEREQFREAWGVYLPSDSSVPPTSERDNVTRQRLCGEEPSFQPVTPDARHVSENAVSASENAGCHGVTLQKPGDGGGNKRTGTVEKPRIEVRVEPVPPDPVGVAVGDLVKHGERVTTDGTIRKGTEERKVFGFAREPRWRRRLVAVNHAE